MRTLEAAGFVAADAWRSTRRLILPSVDHRVRVLVAKPADLLTYVEHGAADLGIAGKDMLLEQDRDVYELVDLGFGACRGVVAFPEARAGVWETLSGPTGIGQGYLPQVRVTPAGTIFVAWLQDDSSGNTEIHLRRRAG